MREGLFQGDVLSASQDHEGRHTRAIDELILRLMLAVFDGAWADASYHGSLGAVGVAAHEAVDWFVNPDDQGPFAFGNVCEVLGFDVNATRAKICEKLKRSPRRTLTRRPPSRPNPKLIARCTRGSCADSR